MAKYTIEVTPLALGHLNGIRPFDRRRIVDELTEQLQFEPTRPTRNRKLLKGVTPAFAHQPPVWELRVGSFRVFYDVDDVRMAVIIRAVLAKGPSQTTGQVINERDVD